MKSVYLGLGVTRAVLALSITALTAACGGGDGYDEDARTDTGGDPGLSRQFDEYPATLSIEGQSIIESGATVTLQARADNNEYRGPAYLTLEAAQRLQVRSAPAGLLAPASVDLREEQTDRNFLSAGLEVTAPVVAAPTQFSVSVENPRARAERELTVVPAGTLYIRRLLLARPIVEAGQSVAITIEFSQPVPVGTAVQLTASTPVLSLPASVTVQPNARDATLDARRVTVLARAQELTGQEYVTVSATLNGLSQQAALWVRSTEAFVLAIDLSRHYDAPSRQLAQVRLSKPAGPRGLAIALSNNNLLVSVPDSLLAAAGEELVELPFSVGGFIGLSAMRITASGGGTTRIGDALLGRDQGTPEILSLALRSFADTGHLSDSCFDSEPSSGEPVLGRAQIHLDRPAPVNGFRVNVFARRADFFPQQVYTIPAGHSMFDVDFSIPRGTASDLVRFITVTARAVDTLQERSAILTVGASGDIPALSGGSLIQRFDYVPYFDTDPMPAAGGVLRGRVTLNELDANRNPVEAHAHPLDDIPVVLVLSDPTSGFLRLPPIGLMIPALRGYADFALPLRQGVAREITVTASGPCDLQYRRTIRIAAGGTLADARMEPRYIFGGSDGSLTVTLSEAAPAGGAVVELNSGVPAALFTLPAQVTVPAGARSASVPFTTRAVSAFVNVDVVARYGNSTTARVQLMPEPEPIALTFVPPTLSYDSTATLHIDLPRSYPVPLVASLSAADVDSAALLGVPRTVALPVHRSRVIVPIPVAAAVPGMTGGQTPVAVSASVRAASGQASAEIASIFSWYDIGAPISMAQIAQAPSLSRIVDNETSGRLLLASVDTELGAPGRLFIRKYNHSSVWPVVGPGALNPTSITTASQPFVLLDDYDFGAVGQPATLAFSQGNGAEQNVFVVRFNDAQGQWRHLSDTQTRLNTQAGVSRAVNPVLASLGLGTNNQLRIGLAFIENGAVQFLWFDGGSWHNASPPVALAGSARQVQFLGSRDGIARLVWVDDNDAATPIKGAELDLRGDGWTALPPPAVPPAQPGSMRLAFFAASDRSNTVAWSQSTLPAQVLSAQFNAFNRTWSVAPVDGPADPNARLTALAVVRGLGEMRLLYATDAGPGARTIYLRRLDGTAWVNDASPDVSTQRVVELSAILQVGFAVAMVRQSDDGTQHTLQVRGVR